MKAREALRAAVREFAASGIEGPRLDAEILLSRSMSLDRATLYARLDEVVGPEAEAAFASAAARRIAGEPVAYITGEKEFYSLPFEVGPGVFIPRPETERLVDLARQCAGGAFPVLVDACTGSGAVAVAARLKAGFAEVHATDCSADALAYARRNAARLGAPVEFHLGDLLEPAFEAGLAGRVDAVCCNPPYVKSGELASLPKVVKCEPVLALDGGADGLDVVRRLAARAAKILKPSGGLFVEIGEGQGGGALEAARAAGFCGALILEDLAGLERYLAARGPSKGH